MADDAGLGGLYLVACLGESGYRSQVADGFDAGVLFRYPFTRTTEGEGPGPADGPWPGPGAQALPVPEVLADPPAEFTGRIMPAVYPTGTTPRGRVGRAWWPPGPRPSGSPPTSAGGWSWRRRSPEDEQVLVIKSWNEWAEGNYLEPDREVRDQPGSTRSGDELVRAGHGPS